MNKEERIALIAANHPEVTSLCSTDAYFNWKWMGCGFGQLSFHFDKDAMTIECMNECMSRDSVRKILHAFADFVADRAILLDNLDDIPKVNLTAEIDQADKEYDAYLASIGVL